MPAAFQPDHRCPACGYDLATLSPPGVAGEITCPECGGVSVLGRIRLPRIDRITGAMLLAPVLLATSGHIATIEILTLQRDAGEVTPPAIAVAWIGMLGLIAIGPGAIAALDRIRRVHRPMAGQSRWILAGIAAGLFLLALHGGIFVLYLWLRDPQFV